MFNLSSVNLLYLSFNDTIDRTLSLSIYARIGHFLKKPRIKFGCENVGIVVTINPPYTRASILSMEMALFKWICVHTSIVLQIILTLDF